MFSKVTNHSRTKLIAYVLIIIIIVCPLSYSATKTCSLEPSKDLVDDPASQTHKYSRYRPESGSLANSTLHVKDTVWYLSNSKNANPTWENNCTVGDLLTNKYPIGLVGHDYFTFIGGMVVGEVPQHSERRPTYCNSAAVTVQKSTNTSIQNIRIDGVWDAVRFERDASNFSLESSWISNVRDDCVENDQVKSGKIIDVLFDGCFVGISVAPGNIEKYTNLDVPAVVELDKVLMRMKAYPHRKSQDHLLEETHGYPFKGSKLNPSFIINNSVFALEVDSFEGLGRWTSVIDNTIECNNNIILWMSNVKLPEYLNSFPSCYKVIIGERAISIWKQLKSNWINCHSDIQRLDDDPVSDIDSCVSEIILSDL